MSLSKHVHCWVHSHALKAMSMANGEHIVIDVRVDILWCTTWCMSCRRTHFNGRQGRLLYMPTQSQVCSEQCHQQCRKHSCRHPAQHICKPNKHREHGTRHGTQRRLASRTMSSTWYSIFVDVPNDISDVMTNTFNNIPAVIADIHSNVRMGLCLCPVSVKMLSETPNLT